MARKKTKSVIPKRIAGVKVPKKVRKGRFGELLASKAGQAVIAQAILGAGAVAAGFAAKDNPKVRRAMHDAKDIAHDAKEKVTRDASDAGAGGSAFAYALGEAARTFAEALRHGEPRSYAATQGDGETAWTPDYGAPEATTNGGRKREGSAQETGPR